MSRLAPAVLALALAVAGCTTGSINPQTGEVQVSRFWSDVGLNGQRDCSIVGKLPAEILLKLTAQQLLLLCSGNFSYSSTAGDPNMAAAIGALAMKGTAAAAGAP